MSARWVARASVISALSAVACGRTPLDIDATKSPASHGAAGSAGSEASECLIDADCTAPDLCSTASCSDGRCLLLTKVCTVKDACSVGSCNQLTGACDIGPATLDLDGDGHRAPLPGTIPGAPDSCGDDCNDADPSVYPGAPAVCGRDTSCAGTVPPVEYIPYGGSTPSLVSGDSLGVVEPAGVVYAGQANGYLATYTGEDGDRSVVFLRSIAGDGTPAASMSAADDIAADAQGGAVAWTGDRYGVAWSDRRTSSYELYFNTFDISGKKFGPDVMLSTNALGNLYPTVVWNGARFLVAWQANVANGPNGSPAYAIQGRELDLSGNLTSNVLTLEDDSGSESPSLAVSSKAIALTYRTGDSEISDVFVRVGAGSLASLGARVRVGANDRFETPRVAVTSSAIVATWVRKQPFIVEGAVLSFDGTITVPTTTLSEPGSQNRDPLPIVTGDSIVLVYSRQLPDFYQLESRAFSPTLTPLGTPAQLTTGDGNKLGASIALGPNGDVGLLFSAPNTVPGGTFQQPAAYFTRLACQPLTMP